MRFGSRLRAVFFSPVAICFLHLALLYFLDRRYYEASTASNRYLVEACWTGSTMFWFFMAGWWLLGKIFLLPFRSFAIAQVFSKEALQSKLIWTLLLLTIGLLAFLPLGLSDTSPLRYRMQTYLSFGIQGVGAMLGLSSILMACQTICSELRDRRSFMLLVKPLTRFEYLCGKWFGLIALNALFLAVVGSGIALNMYFLAQRPALDPEDRQAAFERVLQARAGIKPMEDTNLELRVQEYYQGLLRQDPDLIKRLGEEATLQEVREVIKGRSWSIGPAKQKTFVFDGIDRGMAADRSLALRFKLNVTGYVEGKEALFTLLVNGRSHPIRIRFQEIQLLKVPSEWIGPDGRMELTLINRHPEAQEKSLNRTVWFSVEQGVELTYAASSFGANLVRTLSIYWFKLNFLCMLGLFAGSFLSFSIATMFCCSVYLLASASEFLLGALGFYGSWETAEGLNVLALLLKWPLEAIVKLLTVYSRQDPLSLMVEGYLVQGGMILESFGVLGFIWCGMTGLFAWIVFSRRELAEVEL